MIPWLTEWLRPKGLPIARTHEPTLASSLLPSRAAGRSARSSLRIGDVGLAVEPDFGRVERPAIAEEDVDLGVRGAGDDVVVRQHDERPRPLGPDDHARAGLLVLAGRGSSSRRPTLWATRWTTDGETALATSSKVG